MIIHVPGKGLAAGLVLMVEQEEELVRRAREGHWAVWGLKNGLETVGDTQGLCDQAGGRDHQMRLVGPDANGRCQSVGQKIFQCCQPPATTILPSISPPSTLPCTSQT